MNPNEELKRFISFCGSYINEFKKEREILEELGICSGYKQEMKEKP